MSYVPTFEDIVWPVVTRLATLPYWSSYWQWTDHLAACTECAAVMVNGSQLISDLCPEGKVTAGASRWDIETQHDVAQLN